MEQIIHNNLFHSLQVKSIQKTTPDCSVIELEIPPHLQETFSFKAGQYLTFEENIDGETVRRCYSLCSNPYKKEWKIGVKKIEGGKFSTFANDVLKAGDQLQTIPPDGHFFIDIQPEIKRNYVAFAAGSGITPIASIIQTHLEAEPLSTFKLFYINKSITSIILREEIEALKNKYMERFEVYHFFTRQRRSIDLFNGRLDEEKLTQIFKTLCKADQVDHFFSCGPEAMIKCIETFLLDAGVDQQKIHYELFGTDTGESQQKAESIKAQFKGEQCNITVIEGGKEISFKAVKGACNILDEALNNAADLPYACKGGVCATCIAKLIKGEVNMLVSYGLEQEQIDEGFILTCQSLPVSDEILVDYDV